MNINVNESENENENESGSENENVSVIENESENDNENENGSENMYENENENVNENQNENGNENENENENENVNENENMSESDTDTDEFVDASSEVVIFDAVDDTPTEMPEEIDDYKTELVAQIKEPAEVDTRWLAVHETLIRASDEECTQEYLEELHWRVIKVLIDSVPCEKTESTRRKKGQNKNKNRSGKPPTRAQRRRYLYARTQDMYNKCPKKLADLVVENDYSLLEKTDLPEKEAVAKLYGELWGQKGPDVIDWGDDISSASLKVKDIFKPIEAVEVRTKITKLASDVAPGLDGVKKTHLRTQDTEYLLAKYFNLLLLKSYYPNDWKQNRTTLIPKVGRDRKDVKNWRPLTIGSLVGRLFSGLLDKRLRMYIAQYPRQKGFSDENGCYINTITLNCAIRAAKRAGGIVGITDIEKAFDTVPHLAISKALQRKGVPEVVVTYISNMYQDCVTTIKAAGGDIKIHLKRGVKQGDPLSPLIFNLCIEPLIKKIQETTSGIIIGEEQHVAAIGFADDLVLLAQDKKTAVEQFEKAHAYLNKMDMRLSLEKCTAIEYIPKSKSYYIQDPNIWVNNTKVATAEPEEVIKYLGTKIKPWHGLMENFELQSFEELIRRVKKLALKPMQKIELLRVYLIPRYTYGLINKPPSVVTLRAIDKLIRKEAKAILNIHETTCNEFLYTPKRSGGLGLPEIEKLVLIAALRNGLKAKEKESIDRVTAAVMETERVEKDLKRYANLLRLNWPVSLQDVDKFKKGMKMAYLKNWARHESQGQGVMEFHNDPVANERLKRGDILKPSLIAKAIKLRTDTAGTRMAIRRDSSKKRAIPAECRKCGYERENLPHILGQCINTKNSRIRRHNEIKDIIRDDCAKRFRVLDEPRLYHDGRLYKPDLVIDLNEAGALIVDITVRYEKNTYLVDAGKEKRNKYDDLRRTVGELLNKKKVEIAPIVVGTRGALPVETRHSLKKLGINKKGKWLTIAMTALRHAILIIDKFNDYDACEL